MGHGVTFVHAADLRLGATFTGLISASDRIASQLAEATTGAFTNIIDLCIKRKVDFLVLAGNTFNGAPVSFRAQQAFLEGMGLLAQEGIDVFLCAGRHDQLQDWEGLRDFLPASVHVFGVETPDYYAVQRDGQVGAVIGGRSYSDQVQLATPVEGLSREQAIAAAGEAPVYIGVLHADIGTGGFPACSARELAAAGFDYWALGSRLDHEVYPDIPAVYPGAPQVLSATGGSDRGCYLVTITEGKPVHTTFFRTSAISWANATIDVSDVVRASDLIKMIIRKGDELMFEHKTNVCARIVFVGSSRLCAYLSNEQNLIALREEVTRRIGTAAPWLYIDDLVNRTTPQVDTGSIAAEGMFESILLEQADRLKAEGEHSLAGVSNSPTGLGLPTSADDASFCEVVERAGGLCLNLLNEGA